MNTALIVDLPREDIGYVLSGSDEVAFRNVPAADALRKALPTGQVRIGFWGEQKTDSFPDFCIVSDEELADTNAWLSAFLPGLTPISQWCRIIAASKAERMATRLSPIKSSMAVAPWVGAILSEASVQPGRHTTAKDTPTLSAICSPTFAAARAASVWRDDAPLSDVANRFEEVSRKLGLGPKGFDTKQLLPLWQLLQGKQPFRKIRSDGEIFEPFFHIVDRIAQSPDHITPTRSYAKFVGDYFGVPEIELCSYGAQSIRVSALDTVAMKMLKGPRSMALEAVLGFSASLIDPGIAVMPDLLRRYSERAPLAPIWTGAFAGYWSPTRVLSENGGLSRILSKEITKSSDLFEKPSADISFDELNRWIGSGIDNRPRIRGLNPNHLYVELVDGVSVPFLVGAEASRNTAASANVTQHGQRSLEFKNTEDTAITKNETENRQSRSTSENTPLQNILRRLDALEKSISDLNTKTTRAGNKSLKKTQ